MTKLPKSITDLAASLSALPGIGPKMANRLAVYLVTSGRNNGGNLVRSLNDAQDHVVTCLECGNLSEQSKCEVCLDDTRDRTSVMVVETPMDLIQIEQTDEYRGRYLVLGRLISPINGVGPSDINVHLLTNMLNAEKIDELILALSPSVEGEATSLFLTNLANGISPSLKVSRLARGLPTGVGIEYLDKETLKGALSGRREFVSD